MSNMYATLRPAKGKHRDFSDPSTGFVGTYNFTNDSSPQNLADEFCENRFRRSATISYKGTKRQAESPRTPNENSSTLFRGVRTHDPLNNVGRFRRESIAVGGFGDSKVESGKEKASPVKNERSTLLLPEENRVVFDILGTNVQTLAVAVAKLLLPSFNKRSWRVRDTTGVACLVKDVATNVYYIQLVSFGGKKVVFSQEVYEQFDFQMPTATFITFEGDTSVVAILFADKIEAAKFRKALELPMVQSTYC